MVSVGEHPPWFSKYNLSWNHAAPPLVPHSKCSRPSPYTPLLKKNAMSHFSTQGVNFVPSGRWVTFLELNPLLLHHLISFSLKPDAISSP